MSKLSEIFDNTPKGRAKRRNYITKANDDYQKTAEKLDKMGDGVFEPMTGNRKEYAKLSKRETNRNIGIRRAFAKVPKPFIKEGVLRSFKRHLTANGIKAKLSAKLDAKQKQVGNGVVKLDKIANSPHVSKIDRKNAGDLANRRIARHVELGKRLSALKKDKEGNMFMPDWPKQPKDLKYMTKEEDMRSETEALLQSVIDQKPLDTKNAFDSLIKSKLGDMLDVYKDNIAAQAFGGEEGEEETPEEDDGVVKTPGQETEVEDDTEEETPEETPEEDDVPAEDDGEELTDAEIEDLIGNLSDEDLEKLINDIDDETPDEPVDEPEEDPDQIAETK